MKIAIIVGSIREGRRGLAVGQWVAEKAAAREAAEYTLVDLADHPLSMRYEQRMDRTYAEPSTQAWSDLVDSFDGYVFVTPEYNHSVPAPMKNAVDLLFPEWGGKGVAFVGYGGVGAARAIEHWRGVAATVHLHSVREAVHLYLNNDFGDDGFAPQEFRAGELDAAFDRLEKLVALLRP